MRRVCLVLLPALAIGVAAGAQEAGVGKDLQNAVEEFKVQTRNYGLRLDSPRRSADPRRTRSQWHGRIFENFRNNFLDAVPHEIRQRGGRKGFLRRNQFGFNISGPLVIPRLYSGGRRTFFSLSYEGVREGIARSYLRTIPTAPERSGDFSAVVDQAGQPLPIYDPASTRLNPGFDPSRPVSRENLQYAREPFPGNRIPGHRLDPASRAAAPLYPAPNSDAGPFFRNNYFILAPETNKANGMILKLDHTVRERHRVSMELSFSNGLAGSARWFPSIANPGPPDREFNSRRGSIEHVFTASAGTINTLTVDASTDGSRNSVESGPAGPFPSYRFSPYLSMGRSYPVSRNARNNFTVTDGLSLRHGKHRLRLVGEVSRQQVHSFWPQYPSGSFQFSAGLTSLPGIVNTGHAFASFLLGLAEQAEVSLVGSPSYFRRSSGLVAFRDQYEPFRGLNFNFGLNLDITTPRREKFDRQSTISREAINPANGLPGALVAAGHGGQGSTFQPVRTRLEPSASLAWNPRGDPRTVVRLSGSLRYSSIPVYFGQWGTQGFNVYPTFISPNVQLEPAVKLADGLPPPKNPPPDLRPEAANDTVADLIDQTDRQPRYRSASLSVEREMPGSLVVAMGASHSDGKDLLVGNSAANPNAIPIEALRFRDQLNHENFRRSLRPFPHYQGFDVYSSFPLGRYQRDSGFLRVEKRTSAGLSLTAYYEFSKQMDDYSGPNGTQDFFNRDNEWSLTAGNNPHRFSLSYAYELPLGPGKTALAFSDWRRHLVEGWSVSGMTTVSSGEPVALTPQFNNTGGVLRTLNVNTVPGVDPRVPDPSPHQWFNPAAFLQPPDFSVGDASRTHPFLSNPGSQNHDLSLTKRFALNAERAVEFSAVGFNFINTANWNEPDSVIGTAEAPNVNAGKIIGSRGGRVIQLGLRFSF